MTKASTAKRKKPRERSFKTFVSRLETLGLHEEVAEHARRVAHITLNDLYEGSGRIPSTGDARKAVYRLLAERYGKGINEIARLFDRSPSGVMRLLRQPRGEDAQCTNQTAVWCPVCGNCTCNDHKDLRCPLHGKRTKHARRSR